MSIKMSIKRGDIWIADLGKTTGSEQAGLRPVIIMQNDYGNNHAPTVNVIPLTAKRKKELPPHYELQHSRLKKPSIALTEGITTISIEKLINFKGIVNDEDMKNIERKLIAQLGIKNV